MNDLEKDFKDIVIRLDTCVAYMREDFPAEAQSINLQIIKMMKKYDFLKPKPSEGLIESELSNI